MFLRLILFPVAALAAMAANAAPIVTTVDSAGSVGSYSSLQLNGGNPVVSYFDESRGALKLATCTAGCGSSTPTYVVTTVDTGNAGMYTSLQLNAGAPVIAYHDVGHRTLKLATCTAGCTTAAPTWVIVTVDASSADTGRFPSLLLVGGNPVIAYRDRTNGDLKLATCTAACATSEPSWIITTVDRDGDTGRFASMQLDSGRPVIAYFDAASGRVKLATCTAGCGTSAPARVISVIDTVPGDDEMKLSLALDAGNPLVSYFDAAGGSLKLAVCTQACASANPTWVVTTVERGGLARMVSPSQQSAGSAGQFSSLQLRGGRPVIAYHGSLLNCTTTGKTMTCGNAVDLRLATCIAACATDAPVWVITTLDNGGATGWDPSMVLDGDTAIVSFQEFNDGDLRVAFTSLAEASVPANHGALWWWPKESGWGVNFTHQGDTVFGSLFTYDASGNPMWLFMPSGQRQSGQLFTGALYRATGPAFDAKPFVPINASNLTQVGTMTVSFSGDSATLLYEVGGVPVQKTIKKYVFGSRAATCHPTSASRESLTNYQDLWWNSAESGWGLNVAHQDETVFATLFTYDSGGRAIWFMAPGATKQSDGSYAGDFYRTRGPAFNATPFVPIGPPNLTRVGMLRLSFANGESAMLTYSVDGVTVVKSITRDVFATPVQACAG